MHRSHIARTALAAFLLGITIASYVVMPSWIFWALMLCGGISFLSASRMPWLMVIGWCCIMLALGIGRTEKAMMRQSSLYILAVQRPEVSVEGYVDGDFERTSNGGKYTFQVRKIYNEDWAQPVRERIIVYGADWVRPRYGQELVLTGKIQQPKNAGDFDYVSYLAKEGIRVTMQYPAYGVPEKLSFSFSDGIRVSLGRGVRTMRYALSEAISRAVPLPEAGYLNGILVGDKSDIDKQLSDAFSRTGTSHVMAISGYNITIIAGAMMAFLSRLGPARAYILTVIGIIAFTLMVGASPSVVRAAIMGILALTALRLGRQSEAGTAILFAAAVMGAVNPLLLRWDVGFQLSFLAVAGIIYIEPHIKKILEQYSPSRILVSLIATTISAQIAVLPLILHTFGVLPVYTLPVNIVVLPFIPLAMALGMATGIAGMLLPFLGSVLGQLAWIVAALQLVVIRFVADLPYASVEFPISGAVMVASYTVLAVGVIFMYRRQAKTNITSDA